MFEVTLNKGSSGHLPCQANGVPTPTVKWYNTKNHVISSTSLWHIKQHELTIDDVKLHDSGVFYCEAVNVAGKARKKFQIHVQGEFNNTESSL